MSQCPKTYCYDPASSCVMSCVKDAGHGGQCEDFWGKWNVTKDAPKEKLDVEALKQLAESLA